MGDSTAPKLRSIRLEGQLYSSYTNTSPAPVPQGRHRVPPKFWVLSEAHWPFCVPEVLVSTPAPGGPCKMRSFKWSPVKYDGFRQEQNPVISFLVLGLAHH